MSRMNIMALTIVALFGLLAIAWSARRASNAIHSADAAERLMQECAMSLATIETLEAQSERVFLTVPENDDVQQQIVQTLNDLGLSRDDTDGRADALQGLTDGGTKPIRSQNGTLPHRRREMNLSLHPLTLAHIGEFLAEWRARSPAWVPTDINLTVHQRRGRTAVSNDTPLYSTTITLTSLYLPDGADS